MEKVCWFFLPKAWRQSNSCHPGHTGNQEMDDGSLFLLVPKVATATGTSGFLKTSSAESDLFLTYNFFQRKQKRKRTKVQSLCWQASPSKFHFLRQWVHCPDGSRSVESHGPHMALFGTLEFPLTPLHISAPLVTWLRAAQERQKPGAPTLVQWGSEGGEDPGNPQEKTSWGHAKLSQVLPWENQPLVPT